MSSEEQDKEQAPQEEPQAEEHAYRLIKRRRQQFNLTQKDLVTPKYSITYIRAVEQGEQKPSLEFLEYVGQRLDLTVSELLAGKNFKRNTTKTLKSAQEHYFYNAQVAAELRRYDEAQKHLEKINLKYLPPKLLAGYHNLYGRVLIDLGQYPEGRAELEKALVAYGSDQQIKAARTWHIHNSIAISYYREKNYSEAEKYHLECRDAILRREITDPHFTAEVYYNIGNDYLCLNNFKQAEITPKPPGETTTLAGVYWGMALLAYYSQDSQDEDKEKAEKEKLAAYYYTKSAFLYQELNNISAAITVKGLLGLALTKAKEYDQAEIALNSAVTLAQTHKDLPALCMIYANLAELYRVKGQLDLSEEITEKSLVVARETNNLELIGQTLGQLARVKINAGKEEGLGLFAEAATLLAKIKAWAIRRGLLEDWIAVLKQRGDLEAAFNLYEQLNDHHENGLDYSANRQA